MSRFFNWDSHIVWSAVPVPRRVAQQVWADRGAFPISVLRGNGDRCGFTPGFGDGFNFDFSLAPEIDGGDYEEELRRFLLQSSWG